MKYIIAPANQEQDEEKDKTDGLAPKRSEFLLPEDIIYLDGNSLGPVTKNATKRIKEATEQEWGVGLIRSWNDSGWADLPKKVGQKQLLYLVFNLKTSL